MSSVIKLSDAVDVVIGVDTHVSTHAAAAVLTATGAVLAQIGVEANAEGYAELVAWAEDLQDEHGALQGWAIEGTGSHGRGLAVELHSRGELVVEVDRPVRTTRRGGVKSDPADAIRAAREALSRATVGTPRGAGSDGEQAATRQALATRLAIRRSAVAAASDARRQLFSAVLTAPEPVRERLRGLRKMALVAKAAKLSPTAAWATVDAETATTVACLRQWARRIIDLTREAAVHEAEIKRLVTSWRSDLLAQPGVGPITAATILCAWAYPGRVHSEAAFAKLAGVCPIEATSGQVTTRHRLNRYGDRRLNSALHTIAITRQRTEERTRRYTATKTAAGHTPREVRRCLKRYIARDLYRLLENRSEGVDAT